MVLVMGARGVLGSRVARRLLAAGERVRAVSRDTSGLADLVALGADAVHGDLLEDGWQDAALGGVERVVVASHGLYPPSRTNHPGAVDGTGARRLIDAAARAGVRQLVYVSAAGAERGGYGFARVKHATEQHLRASGVPWTIVRPTVFIENNGLLLLGEPVRAGKPVQLIGAGTTRINWVSGDDVAEDVVRALSDETAPGQVREVRGPDMLSHVEVLQMMETALGRQAKRQHLPPAVARVVQTLAGPVHPGIAYLLGLALSDVGVLVEPADGAVVWVGSTRAEEIVGRWAREAKRASAEA